ncbi:hypothetical protein Tco_1437212 [Tanacetum coccineum]
MLKVSPRKGVIQFGNRGKLNSRYIGPFKILKWIGPVAYTLELSKELSNVHSTFHVSNLKKCISDESLIIPMKELRLDDKLNFMEEPVEIIDREVKQLRQSRIPIVKVRWNSKRGPEFMWEREDQIRANLQVLWVLKLDMSMAYHPGTIDKVKGTSKHTKDMLEPVTVLYINGLTPIRRTLYGSSHSEISSVSLLGRSWRCYQLTRRIIPYSGSFRISSCGVSCYVESILGKVSFVLESEESLTPVVDWRVECPTIEMAVPELHYLKKIYNEAHQALMAISSSRSSSSSDKEDSWETLRIAEISFASCVSDVSSLVWQIFGTHAFMFPLFPITLASFSNPKRCTIIRIYAYGLRSNA